MLTSSCIELRKLSRLFVPESAPIYCAADLGVNVCNRGFSPDDEKFQKKTLKNHFVKISSFIGFLKKKDGIHYIDINKDKEAGLAIVCKYPQNQHFPHQHFPQQFSK